jgi:outer membrane receptor protein involved in Fe transport
MRRFAVPWVPPLMYAAALVPIPYAGAGAEEPLATIEVTAEPLSEAEERAPTSFVTVIDVEQHREQIETVGDALAETVGVQVRRFGGLGAFSTVSIRGSSPNQVQIFLDGVPLSRARNETVNLADLPLDSLARIEVYRGAAPVRFGTTAVGGVVNLVTKPPSAEPHTELSAAYGSFTTRKAVGAHTRRLGGVDVLGFLTYLGSEGDFTYVDRVEAAGEPPRTGSIKRINNRFDSVDALLKAGADLGTVRLDLTSEAFFKDQGLAGVGSDQAHDAGLSTFRSLNYLRAGRAGLLGDTLDATATLFGEFQRDRFDDTQRELSGISQKRRDDAILAGVNGVATWYPLPAHAVTGFLQIGHDRFAPYNDLDDLPPSTQRDEPDQTRLQLAVAIEDQIGFLNDRVLLVPAIRYEHLRDRISATSPAGEIEGEPSSRERDLWSPSIGVQVRPWPWLALKGNLARSHRAPNFSELFANTGITRGDATLESETAINRDIGFVADYGWPPVIGRVHLEYAYFNNDVDDLIQFVEFSQGVSRPLNIGAARIRGHEIVVSGVFLDHIGVDVNYTHQDAEDRGDEPHARGNQLPFRPADEVYTQLALFGRSGRLYYELNYVGGNFLDRINFDRVPSRDLHTLGLSYRPAAWLTLTFEARNITGNQVRDVADFPLPGLTFLGGVKVQL